MCGSWDYIYLPQLIKQLKIKQCFLVTTNPQACYNPGVTTIPHEGQVNCNRDKIWTFFFAQYNLKQNSFPPEKRVIYCRLTCLFRSILNLMLSLILTELYEYFTKMLQPTPLSPTVRQPRIPLSNKKCTD